MKIRIIQVGKTSEKYISEAANEYLKRLRPYADIEIVTIRDQGNAKSDGEKNVLKKKEAEAIISKIAKTDFIIALDEKGSGMTSVEFAGFIKKLEDSGRHVCFIVGGVYGLADDIISRADYKLSFSKFTFTHEMIRPLLLEQLYRSYTINGNKRYHY